MTTCPFEQICAVSYAMPGPFDCKTESRRGLTTGLTTFDSAKMSSGLAFLFMMGFMFDPYEREDGTVEIRTENGIAHLTKDKDGTWTVREDPKGTKFPDRGKAFDCVRKLRKVKD